MAKNLSEIAVMCNFKFFNLFGLNFAEKDWFFGKYMISYLAFFGSLVFVMKCWLTFFYKDFVTDNWSFDTNFTFLFYIATASLCYLTKLMLMMWKKESIYNLTELLKIDLIVIENVDKRLEKDQQFCVKMAKSVFR